MKGIYHQPFRVYTAESLVVEAWSTRQRPVHEATESGKADCKIAEYHEKPHQWQHKSYSNIAKLGQCHHKDKHGCYHTRRTNNELPIAQRVKNLAIIRIDPYIPESERHENIPVENHPKNPTCERHTVRHDANIVRLDPA